MTTERAYAKLNITLDVLGKLPGGYHELCMVMESVDLCDEVEIKLRHDGQVRLDTAISWLPRDKRNLAVAAVYAFRAALGDETLGADLRLKKRIPVGAGMAGGSSDGAAVLRAMNSLTGAMTNPLVHLMSMENYYLSMYDAPELLHKVMDNACSVYERYYDFLEENGLLLPTSGVRGVAQESFAFNHELPEDRAVKTTDVWGFLESQETTAVSPATFEEFVFPYQDRLAKRFGLLSYGCCERVDAIWPQISRWKNLRKLSVSPFNNEPQVGEFLRGTNVVYYSKPRSEYLTLPGPLDEAAITECFKKISEAASGCMLEIAQREVNTIFGDYERGRRYVQLAKEAVERYWKP